MHTAFGFDLGANECVCVAVFSYLFLVAALLLSCGGCIVGGRAVGGWADWGWVTAD